MSISLQTKTVVPFEIKAADDNARTLTGLAAAWSLDQGGDIIEKGAFKRTLDQWRIGRKARPIPLLDQHAQFDSIRRVLGKMTEAVETDDGLEATFEFVPDDPDADAAYRRAKGGFVSGLSIGYEAREWKDEPGKQRQKIRRLTEIKLHEVSMVIFPMNDDARIASVKALDALAGALRDGRLSDEQKQHLRALLDAPPADAHDDAPPADETKGLAPDDPKRLEIEALFRAVTLRSLSA